MTKVDASKRWAGGAPGRMTLHSTPTSLQPGVLFQRLHGGSSRSPRTDNGLTCTNNVSSGDHSPLPASPDSRFKPPTSVRPWSLSQRIMVVTLLLVVSLTGGQGLLQDATALTILSHDDGASSNNTTIHIAALLPSNYRRFPFAYQIVMPAAELAVRNVTGPGGPLAGRDIRVHIQDSECSSAAAMNQMFNFYIQKKVRLICF